jgi:hypothetical protein
MVSGDGSKPILPRKAGWQPNPPSAAFSPARRSHLPVTLDEEEPHPLRPYKPILSPSTAIISKEGIFMAKENIITPTPTLPTVPPRTETPVRTLPIEEARKLIRKTSKQHAELFRLLAK